jgi:hypothetical protein
MPRSQKHSEISSRIYLELRLSEMGRLANSEILIHRQGSNFEAKKMSNANVGHSNRHSEFGLRDLYSGF